MGRELFAEAGRQAAFEPEPEEAKCFAGFSKGAVVCGNQVSYFGRHRHPEF